MAKVFTIWPSMVRIKKSKSTKQAGSCYKVKYFSIQTCKYNTNALTEHIVSNCAILNGLKWFEMLLIVFSNVGACWEEKWEPELMVLHAHSHAVLPFCKLSGGGWGEEGGPGSTLLHLQHGSFTTTLNKPLFLAVVGAFFYL